MTGILARGGGRARRDAGNETSQALAPLRRGRARRCRGRGPGLRSLGTQLPAWVHRSYRSVAQMSLTFRTATQADVPALAALVHATYRSEESTRGWTSEAHLVGGQRTDETEMADIIGTPGRRMLIAETDGEVVGCCQVVAAPGPGTSAFLGMLSVRPGSQGGGIGRAMVAEAERIAVEEGGAGAMGMAVIRQRTELIAWYERLGYARTGETEPFPYGDARVGTPKVPDLEFVVLLKALP